jgi:hypothetical protein
VYQNKRLLLRIIHLTKARGHGTLCSCKASSHFFLGLAEAALIVRRISLLIDANSVLVGTFFNSFLRLSFPMRGVL